MRISIKSRDGAVPDKLRVYAEKKLGKLTRYFQSIQAAELSQFVERGQHIVELSVEGDGVLMRSQERCGDPFAAVDNAVDKMERQVKRFKTRRRSERQRAGNSRDEELAATALESGWTEDEEDEEALPPITRRKRFPMKPMPPEEAARQMELLDHSFFLFLNEETGTVNVLYRRRGGGYGIIEPET